MTTEETNVSFEVVEQFLLSKKGDSDGGEDAIFVNEYFAVVIDGASAKGAWFLGAKEPSGGIASGRLCRDALLASLGQVDTKIDGWAFVQSLNDAVADLRRTLPEGSPLPQASMVAYSASRQEVWSFGDCQCIVAGSLHAERKAIDLVHAERRRKALEEALASGKTVNELRVHDIGRIAILDGLKDQHRFANKDVAWGYPVLDGGQIRRGGLTVYPVPAGSEVVLASDGYPFLKGSLAESEQALGMVLAADPLMMRLAPETKGMYPGQVSYDDRCYLRLQTHA